MTELDDQVVAEFRANGGVVLDAMGGHFSNIHLLLLHNTGRRSGRPYVGPAVRTRTRAAQHARPHSPTPTAARPTQPNTTKANMRLYR